MASPLSLLLFHKSRANGLIIGRDRVNVRYLSQMKIGWGIGIAIAVLASLASFFFGLFGPLYSSSSIVFLVAASLLLSGLWTIASAFLILEAKDRIYYSVWGVVLFCLSLFAFVPPAYAAGVLVVAIIVLILLVIYAGRAKGIVSATASPPQAAGGVRAAEAKPRARNRPAILLPP